MCTCSASGAIMRVWMCTLCACATLLWSRLPSVCRLSWQFSNVCLAVLKDSLGALSTFLAVSLCNSLACTPTQKFSVFRWKTKQV